MWNPFKRKRKVAKFNFDFCTFKNLFQYLQNEKSLVSVNIDGFENEAEMMWYEFPNSYLDSTDDLTFLENSGFNSFYELLNVVYEKSAVSPVDVSHDMEANNQYDLMVFNYYLQPNANEETLSENVKISFYLVFVCENESEEINGVRILYAKGMDYSVANFVEAKFLVDINNPDPEDEVYVSAFEKIVAAFSLETNVEINKEIVNKYSDFLSDTAVSKDDFRNVLTNLNFKKRDNVEELVNYLYDSWQNDWSSLFTEVEYYDDGYFPLRFSFLDDDNTRFSDWKFDPEDVEEIISQLLGEEWTFNYPNETYSHDLFPYIQKELSQLGLELMHMDTLGDSYQFFIVKKENVDAILSISRKLKLGVEQVNN